MPRPALRGLQPLLQLLGLLLGLARGLAGVPQGALHLPDALLQLPVPPLGRGQALLQLAASLLLLEERGLHRGAQQLRAEREREGKCRSELTYTKGLFSLQANQSVVNPPPSPRQLVL